MKDPSIPFERHLGNPLTRIGPDRYAVHRGLRAEHWLDGKKVVENTKAFPCTASRLTLGVGLPNWGGPTPWKTSWEACGRVRVWEDLDPGDVRGLLAEGVKDTSGRTGRPVRGCLEVTVTS